jgi:uncharacterized RDD family membrane protein YckC
LRVLRLSTLIFLGAGFAAMLHAGQSGFSVVTKNHETEVYAGADPISITWSAVAIAVFVVLMTVGGNATVVGVSTFKRRAAAFLIDFWFSGTVLVTVVALVPLWLEARRTGRFSWHFERDYTVGTDALAAPLAVLVLAIIFLYFAFPLTRGKQTVGCFVLRLRVTPPFGDQGRFAIREALRRIGYTVWGLMTWKWALKDFRDSHGRTWWDRETDCRVVLVEYE